MTFDLKIGNSSFTRTNTEQSSLNYCPNEIVIAIFMRCVCIEGNVQGAKAFSLTNHHINKVITQHMSQLDLRVVCPKLTILDAKALGCEVDDEPVITRNMKYQVMECYQNMAPYVGDLGLTLLTMLKGCSVGSLCEEGQTLMPGQCYVDSTILTQIGGDKVQKTYRVLITNNVFSDSRYQVFHIFKGYSKLMSERKCELPTVHEIMATCILTYKASGRVLYSEASVCGSFEAATTYGLTSMCLANQFDCPVCVGYRYVEDLFEFNCTAINLGYSGLTVGAGGKVNL